jgi:hypothetical protein
LTNSCVQSEIKEQKSNTAHDENLYKLKLTRNIGEFVFPIPQSTDTSYSWTSTTDYDCSTKINTRFAVKKYSLLQESGFWSVSEMDSLKQITISWLKNSNCNKFDRTQFEMLVRGKNEFIYISGFPAIRFTYKGVSRNKLPYIRLSTYILIDSNGVALTCQCTGNNCDDIVSDYNKIIEKMEIKK